MADRRDMMPRLLARPHDRETARARPRERVGRGCRGGGGADRGDLAGVDYADRRPAGAVEQDDDALM